MNYVGNAQFWYKNQRKDGESTYKNNLFLLRLITRDLNLSNVSAQTVLSSRLAPVLFVH